MASQAQVQVLADVTQQLGRFRADAGLAARALAVVRGETPAQEDADFVIADRLSASAADPADGLVRFRERDHRYWIRAGPDKEFSSELTFSVSAVYKLAMRGFPTKFVSGRTAVRNQKLFADKVLGPLLAKKQTEPATFLAMCGMLGEEAGAFLASADWDARPLAAKPCGPPRKRGAEAERSAEFGVAERLVERLSKPALDALGRRVAPRMPSEVVGFDGVFPLSAAQVAEGWALKGRTAAALGTALHARIERFYQGQPLAEDAAELERHHFFRLLRDYPEHFSRENAARVELSMAWPELRLAGQLDALFWVRNERGERIGTALVDWKRSEKLESAESPAAWFSERFPAFPRTNFGFYTLQLELYARMLALRGVPVLHRFVVCLHADLPSYVLLRAPPRVAEGDALLERYEAELLRPAVERLERERPRAAPAPAPVPVPGRVMTMEEVFGPAPARSHFFPAS